MTMNTYDTHTLMGVIEQLPPLSTFWLDTVFKTVHLSTTEYIDFDEVAKGRRLAPFVVPTAQGRPMLQKGFTTKRFKPAYIKPKDALDPRRVIKRMAGEPFMGSMSAGSRRLALIAAIMKDHRDMLMRRLEWMAASAVLTDSITISGADYPTTVMSFNRPANHTVTLTGSAQWDQVGVIVSDNIDAWSTRMMQNAGYAPTNLILGTDAWKAFKNAPDVKDQLDTRYRGTEANIQTGIGNGEAVQFKGTLGASLKVYVYNDVYEDDAGTVTPLMDSKSIVLINPEGVEGVQAYGAILDPQAGYVSVPYWFKNWFENDPPAEFVMMQSSPLIVPARPASILVAKVLV